MSCWPSKPRPPGGRTGVFLIERFSLIHGDGAWCTYQMHWTAREVGGGGSLARL